MSRIRISLSSSPRAGVQEQLQDRGVAAFFEAATLTGLEQPPQRLIKDRNRVLRDRWWPEVAHGVGDLFPFLEPDVEPMQRPEPVIGRRRPSALDDIDDVVLDIGGGGVGQARPRGTRKTLSCSSVSKSVLMVRSDFRSALRDRS